NTRSVNGMFILYIFFFSSRRRHTRSKRDWSSDVCSSDLLPEQSLGDMWAQIAALRTGERRFKEICDRYKKENVEASINKLLEQGTLSAKKALKKLPKGTFTAKDFIDDDPS